MGKTGFANQTNINNDVLETVRCIVCGNTKKDLFKEKYKKENCSVYECCVCNFTFIPQYFRKSIDYTKYKPIDAVQEVAKSDVWFKIQRNLLRYNLIKKHTSGKKLFDIGCGFGHFLFTGKQLGYAVTGAEMSKANIEYIRSNFDFPVFDGNLLDVKEDEKYDIMTLWDVLEHMDEADKIVAKVSRMLVPGGHLFIQVPQIDSFFARLLKDKWWEMGLDHVNYFSKKTIKKFYAKYGLEVVKIYSSIELKNVLLYVILPKLKRKRKQQQKQAWTVTDRQKEFNKITNKPTYMRKLIVLIHNSLYKTLAFFHIGDEMIVVARKTKN